MKKLFLKLITRTGFVTVKKDQINHVLVTRLIIKDSQVFKVDSLTWLLIHAADSLSGRYGFRVTIDCSA